MISPGHFESYTPGATIGAQVALGDAIYNSLAAKRTYRASGEALEARRQEVALAAAQQYVDLAKATALVEVNREAVHLSRH